MWGEVLGGAGARSTSELNDEALAHEIRAILERSEMQRRRGILYVRKAAVNVSLAARAEARKAYQEQHRVRPSRPCTR